MHGLDWVFRMANMSECDLKAVFMQLSVADQCCSCHSLRGSHRNSTPGERSAFPRREHLACRVWCIWMGGFWTVSAETRTASTLQTVHQCTVAPPLAHPIFSLSFFLFFFLHKGKMRKNKTNIWKLKHDREGRGGEGEEGEQRKERQSQKTRGLSKVRDES